MYFIEGKRQKNKGAFDISVCIEKVSAKKFKICHLQIHNTTTRFGVCVRHRRCCNKKKEKRIQTGKLSFVINCCINISAYAFIGVVWFLCDDTRQGQEQQRQQKITTSNRQSANTLDYFAKYRK